MSLWSLWQVRNLYIEEGGGVDFVSSPRLTRFIDLELLRISFVVFSKLFNDLEQFSLV